MGRVNNSDMRRLVRQLEPFENNNQTVYARWFSTPHRYVVFSYGNHFPMYVWDDETSCWYGNKDKYSTTTSRHQGQCHPGSSNIVWMDTHDLRNVAEHGYVAAVKCRMGIPE